MSKIKTGQEWAKQPDIKGKTLVLVESVGFSKYIGKEFVVSDFNRIYLGHPDGCHLYNYNHSKFKLKETDMIDWRKPLQIEATGQASVPCKFVTASLRGDRNIVETEDGNVFAVCKITGFVHGRIGCFRVANVKEPWEVAWEDYIKELDASYGGLEMSVFKAGFNYALGSVK
jgi:hypothetical protein